jgi:hypothetical protein
MEKYWADSGVERYREISLMCRGEIAARPGVVTVIGRFAGG